MAGIPVSGRVSVQDTDPRKPSMVDSTAARILPTRQPSLTNLVGSVAPVAVFLLADMAWGLVPGVLASTAAAVVAALARLRGGRGVGWLSLALLGYVLIRGAAGALTGSHHVFFGISVAASMAVAAAVLATAFTTTPLASHLLPLLVGRRLRPDTVTHPTYRRVSAQVTAIWAASEMAVSGGEAWHLWHAGAVEFVATRAFLGWPTMAAIIFVCAFYARFRIELLQGPSTPPG